MPRTREQFLMPDGELCWFREVGFQEHGEYWNSYLLGNGTELRVKTIVTRVLQSEDAVDENGDPIYIVQSQTVPVPSVPGSQEGAEE